MSKSSGFFLVLSVLLVSLVPQNLLPITCLLLGGVSVLLPVKFSSEDYAVTPLFIGGVLCTNLNRNRVGCLIPPLVVQFPFGVLCQPGDVGFPEILEASDPSLPVDCLPDRSSFVQHVASDVLLKTAPKNLVLRQGGDRHQAGSS